MKIAVYSGSFNPLHIGHKAIIEYLVSDMDFDMVYLIVSPQNPLKENTGDASGRKRFRAAEEAVRRCRIGNVRVDDIELGMPAPQYTIRTLEALESREPSNSFTLVMGADQLADIRRWREYRKILTEYGVAVYPRKGFDLQAIKENLMNECAGRSGGTCGQCLSEDGYRIRIIDAPMVDISSTELRNAIMAGADVSAYLM